MKRFLIHRIVLLAFASAAIGALCGVPARQGRADDLPAEVAAAEAKRMEAVKKVQPTVVAVFAPGGQNGGSGVLIDADGYALTNFHVVEACGITMQCGLADGVLYDAVAVGIDKVGDVALIKLLPKTEGQKFPFAKMGDSKKVRAGDWSMAMGNPFLLATDFTPTVTFGLVSGVNRYQYPAGVLLEYTACIQIDTSINPGNSGGPLFNLDGELIGINGRGSFEKRGRVNSGVGYAISINQIKNFEGHLRAGIEADHATLGALVATDEEEGSVGKLTITSIISDCDAARRGLDTDDVLLKFAGEPVATVNEYKNVLGMFPRGWRVPIKFRHFEKAKETDHDVLVRLMGVQRREIKGSGSEDKPAPGPQPGPKVNPKSPAAKFYEAKPGFTNYYFNRKMRDELEKNFRALGDFTKFKGKWTLQGQVTSDEKSQPFEVVLDGDNLVIALGKDKDIKYALDIGKTADTVAKKVMDTPPGSGGFLMALAHYRDLLVMPNGEKTFSGEYVHGGREPLYLLAHKSKDPKEKPNFGAQRIDTAVLKTRNGPIAAKWYFVAGQPVPKAGLELNYLAGFDLIVDEGEDPCEVYLSDYKKIDGNLFPHKFEVQFGDDRYGTFVIEKVEMK